MSDVRCDSDPKVYLPSAIQDKRPHCPNKSDLKDLVWDLGLTESLAHVQR